MDKIILNAKWKINIYRRKKYWEDSKCIFIHVPKAAGTSINKALYGKTLGHYSALEIKNTFPELFSKAFTFSFVRNPWDRVLSAYSFAKKGRTETMGVHRPEQYQIPEYESFEKFLLEWLPSRDLIKSDFIFQPQNNFVCNEFGAIIVDYIGKVESIDSDILEVSKRISRNIDILRTNSTRKSDFDYRRKYHTNEMIDIVSALYHKDINIFNYDFE